MIGRTLGHFRVAGAIGAGGMGEVYRAADLRLGRDVAIKVLPPRFADDSERLARFEQEARLLAALNHPCIAAVHGLEEADGIRFLVMELVPGVTLADRIAQGPLPPAEALGIAARIAEGLEAAHERGIVHRDLKPANVKVTPEGAVKVLDFGLAKVFADEEIAGSLSLSPTLTAAPTRAGTILGTAAYMSPEQARGRPVDRRADVWAFGCVLFEMLTGRQAFAGDTVSDLIASVLTREPDWSALPAATSPAVRRLLRRCLEKRADKRLRDLGDARLEIEEAVDGAGSDALAAGEPGPAAAPAPGRARAAAWILGAVALACAGVAVRSFAHAPAPPQRAVRRLMLLFPPETPPAETGGTLDLVPDGSRLIYAAGYGRTTQIYVRDLDQDTAAAVPGTEGTTALGMSPDGRSVAFVADNKLKRVALAGGTPVTLADCYMPSTPAWTGDDTIIYSPSYNSGLSRIPAGGGTAVALTTPDAAKGELGHWHPSLLPDGRSLLFTIWNKGGLPQTQIARLDLKTGTYRVLVEGGFAGRYARSGHLVYARPGALMAVPFDPVSGALTGTPVQVIEALETNPANASSFFAFDDAGTLIYLAASATTNRIVWTDGSGPSRPITEEKRDFRYPVISPDGSRIALSLYEQGSADLWMLDAARGVLTRLTTSPRMEFMPRWTPDGKRLVYVTDTGAFTLYWMTADGSSPPELLWESGCDKYPGSFSPDGRTLAFTEDCPDTRGDLWILDIDVQGQKKARRLLSTRFDEREPEFSPDGRFLAFSSDESGRMEIYLAPIDNPGGKIRLSTGGGRNPRFARDGRRVVYRMGQAMMAVDLGPGMVPAPGEPRTLLTDPTMVEGWNTQRNYDLAPDGRRLVLIEGGATGSAPTPFNVVVNWFEDLKRRVPVAGR